MGNNLIQRKDSDLRRRVKAGNSTATLKIRNNDGNLRGLVHVPGAGEVSIDEIAAWKFAQPDPEQRFEGLQATIAELLICSLDKISDETASRTQYLLQMMDEAVQGNYSNPTWPARKSQGRGRPSKPSFARSRGFGCLLALIQCRQKHDDIDDQNIGLACSRAALHVDHALKPAGVSLASWLPPYNPDGDRQKNRKTKPRKLVAREEFDGSTHLHERTWQLKSYFDKNIPPSLSDPESEGAKIYNNSLLPMIVLADKRPKAEDRKTALHNVYRHILGATVRAIIESWPR